MLFTTRKGLNVERQSRFYLDAVSGNDSNRGIKEAPWKSLTRLMRAILPPGSTVYYKYAATWTTNAPYRDFSGLSNGAMPAEWLSSSFTISSGSAINSPTIGSDLSTDGAMENWLSATNLTSWTETIAGTTTINREASMINSGTYATRFDVDASNSACSIEQAISSTVNDWIVVSWYAKCSATTCSMVMRDNGVGLSYPNLTTSYAKYQHTHRAGAANTIIKFARDTATSKSIYIDDVTVKKLTFASCLTFRSDPAPSADVRATAAITMPAQAWAGYYCAGVAVKWDSSSNPQNGLLAYIDGAYPGYIYLDQCVAGTWTNLFKVQMTSATVSKYIDGEFIEVSVTGTTATVSYRGGIIGTPQTINAALASNTICGLFSTDATALVSSFAIDYRTVMVTPENLPANITANHQFNRRLYGTTTEGDMGGMASGTTGTADYTRVRRVISPTRGGLYGGRFEVQNGDFAGSTNSGERAEIYILHNPAGADVSETSASGTVYYGISLYVPVNWSSPNELDPNSHSLWGEFLQLHPPAPGSLPSLSIHVRDTIYLANAGGDLEGTYLPWTETQLSDNTVRKGQWTDFVMKLVHANTLTGEIQIWRRNAGEGTFKSVLDLTNVPTLLTQSGYVDGIHLWRRGYYRAQQTSALTNVLCHGPFVRGSTFNDVVAAAFS